MIMLESAEALLYPSPKTLRPSLQEAPNWVPRLSRRGFNRVVTSTFWPLLLTAQGKRYSYRGPDYEVEVISVTTIGRRDGRPLYLVKIAYAFPSRSTLYLKPFGAITNEGEASFITASTTLEFKERPSGTVLLKMPVKETDQRRSQGPDVPSFREFPHLLRSGWWKHPQPIAPHLQRVLLQHFSVLDADTYRDGFHFYITPWRRLDLTVRNLIAQVSVLVRYPDPEPTRRPIDFGVAWIAREKNLLGSWHPDLANATRVAADAFVRSLTEDLSNSDQRR